MAVIVGGRSTENVLQDNRFRDISPVVYNLEPSETPFLTFSQNTKKTLATDPKIEWFGKQPRADSDAINNGGGHNAAATTLDVDNADKFLAGDTVRVVKDADGSFAEMMRVTSVNVGGNQITVARGVGSTAAADLVDNDVLLLLGDAQTEGSSIPDGQSQKLEPRFNFTQIERTSTEYTRTFVQTKMRVDQSEVQRRRDEKSREHKRKLEKTLIWGERAIEGAGSDKPRRYNGGLDFWIQESVNEGIDNTQNQGAGTLTEFQWEEFLETKAFAFGSKNKWLLASKRLISVLNNLLRSRMEVQNMTTEFGLNVSRWVSPHGELKIAQHDLFNFGIFQFAGMVIDPEQVKIKFIGESEMMFRSDIGLRGDDGFTDDWLSEISLEVGTPATLALITNVQNAA